MNLTKFPLHFIRKRNNQNQYNKENYKDSDPLDYYLKGLGHYIMHEETDALLHSLLQMLADKGEEYTFAYIKKNVMK
mgnify:CR=1 FL=1